MKLLVGGSHDGVGAILKDAEEAGYANVFGVIDRDFGRSNYDKWTLPGYTSRCFVLPRHEIENYLLDTPALEGCRFNTRGWTSAEIDAILSAEAKRRCWWAACRDVVSHIRDRFFDQFMRHPTTPPVDTEAAARDHITLSKWFRTLPRKSSRMTELRVHRLLLRAHHLAQRLLIDGGWRVEFSGKEFVREIGNKIFDRAKAPRSYRPSSSEFDADLAKSVATWQVDNNAVPADLIILLEALKARIAASAPPPRG